MPTPNVPFVPPIPKASQPPSRTAPSRTAPKELGSVEKLAKEIRAAVYSDYIKWQREIDTYRRYGRDIERNPKLRNDEYTFIRRVVSSVIRSDQARTVINDAITAEVATSIEFQVIPDRLVVLQHVVDSWFSDVERFIKVTGFRYNHQLNCFSIRNIDNNAMADMFGTHQDLVAGITKGGGHIDHDPNHTLAWMFGVWLPGTNPSWEWNKRKKSTKHGRVFHLRNRKLKAYNKKRLDYWDSRKYPVFPEWYTFANGDADLYPSRGDVNLAAATTRAMKIILDILLKAVKDTYKVAPFEFGKERPERVTISLTKLDQEIARSVMETLAGSAAKLPQFYTFARIFVGKEEMSVEEFSSKLRSGEFIITMEKERQELGGTVVASVRRRSSGQFTGMRVIYRVGD